MLSRTSKTSFGRDVLLSNNLTVDSQKHTVLVDTSHDMIQRSVVEVEICSITVVACIITVVRIVNTTVFLLWVHDTVPSGAGIVSSSQTEKRRASKRFNFNAENSRAGSVHRSYFKRKLPFSVSNHTPAIGHDPRFNDKISRCFVVN